MTFRTSGAVAALLIGLAGAGGSALAQYYPPPPPAYPPPHAYPPPEAYPPPGYPIARGLPAPIEADPAYDPTMRPPLELTAPTDDGRMRRRAPGYADEAALPPPPPAGYRDAPLAPYRDAPTTSMQELPPPPGYPQQGYQPPHGMPQHAAVPQPGHQGEVPPMPQGFEPAAAGSRPYYPGGAAQPAEPDGLRPPMAIRPGQQHDNAPTGAVRGDTRMAALPPEVRPETGPRKELPAHLRRTVVDYRTKEPVGTIIIDTPNTYLYLVMPDGKAMRYGVGVGREGFTWAGAEKVTRMAEWPDWNPPPEMIERQPYLPRFMAGGDGNPMGARALYLGKTVYRIHGTNQPSTIGSFVSSGCIRLTNEDVADLYTRVKVGTRVVVLPGGKQSTASAASYPQASPYPQQQYPQQYPQPYPSQAPYPPSLLPPPPFAVAR